jgi:hypothetical protein
MSDFFYFSFQNFCLLEKEQASPGPKYNIDEPFKKLLPHQRGCVFSKPSKTDRYVIPVNFSPGPMYMFILLF